MPIQPTFQRHARFVPALAVLACALLLAACDSLDGLDPGPEGTATGAPTRTSP